MQVFQFLGTATASPWPECSAALPRAIAPWYRSIRCVLHKSHERPRQITLDEKQGRCRWQLLSGAWNFQPISPALGGSGSRRMNVAFRLTPSSHDKSFRLDKAVLS